MATDVTVGGGVSAGDKPVAAPPKRMFDRDGIARAAEAVLIPLGALVVSLVLFGVFVALAGVNPLDVYELHDRRLVRLVVLDPEHADPRLAAAC